MKKKSKDTGFSFPMFKIDLKLKLTTLFILVTLFNVKANTYAQNTKVSLNLNNTTIEKVLTTIEQKTDFRFIYKLNDIDLDRVVSIRVKDQTIGIVLEGLFKGTRTEYKVRDTQIILKKVAELKTELKTYEKETVNGVVLDERGMPLPGASVLEVGTQNGTSTDFDGRFQIIVESTDAKLLVTYLGYKNQTSFCR